MFGTGINNGSCYWINHFSVDNDYDTDSSEYILRELIFFITFKERFKIFHHFHQRLNYDYICHIYYYFLAQLFQYDISIIMLANVCTYMKLCFRFRHIYNEKLVAHFRLKVCLHTVRCLCVLQDWCGHPVSSPS